MNGLPLSELFDYLNMFLYQGGLDNRENTGIVLWDVICCFFIIASTQGM